MYTLFMTFRVQSVHTKGRECTQVLLNTNHHIYFNYLLQDIWKLRMRHVKGKEMTL